MEKTDAKTKFRQIVPILVLICCTALFSFRHPYHLAVSTITYNAKLKTIDIEYKAFSHDFEEAVNTLSGSEMDIKNHDNKAERDAAVYGYMVKCFSITNDGKAVDCAKTGISFKDEYIFVNYKIENITAGMMQIKNSALYEMEKTQTNLFHFINGKLKETRKMVNPVYIMDYRF